MTTSVTAIRLLMKSANSLLIVFINTMDEWLDEHLDDITIDEILEYERLRKSTVSSALLTFAICLVPQYSLINNKSLMETLQRDVRGKLISGTLALFPFLAGFLVGRHNQKRKNRYLTELHRKYS